jgi:tripartite-type tricarboxylate transporter receptor subunit TctC
LRTDFDVDCGAGDLVGIPECISHLRAPRPIRRTEHGVNRLAAAIFGAAIIAFAALGAAFAAEPWPTRPVTIVVPYGAGGSPDLIARLVAKELSSRLGQSFVVENHLGAGGLVGVDYAAAAKPDGYTLLLGGIDTQAILGHLHPHEKINPTTAFVPISSLGRIADVIAASPHLQITSFAQLIDAGRKGRTFTFSTPGVGTSFHILGELIHLHENIPLTHVPYREPTTGYADVMAGRVDLVISGLPPVLALLKTGKLVPLATTGPKRAKDLPDTPTLAELGFKDLVLTNWFGLLAPAGTPNGVINLLNQQIAEISDAPDYRKRMEADRIEPIHSTPQAFGALIHSEYARFGDVITRANIVVN